MQSNRMANLHQLHSQGNHVHRSQLIKVKKIGWRYLYHSKILILQFHEKPKKNISQILPLFMQFKNSTKQTRREKTT